MTLLLQIAEALIASVTRELTDYGGGCPGCERDETADRGHEDGCLRVREFPAVPA